MPEKEPATHATPTVVRKGFMLFCITLCQGETPVGTIHEVGEKPKWDIYDTERAAQLEILDQIEEHIQQFKDEEREFDEICFDDFYVMEVTEHDDGSLTSDIGRFPPPEQ